MLKYSDLLVYKFLQPSFWGMFRGGLFASCEPLYLDRKISKHLACREKSITIAATISTTPLYNAYQGGTYFLYTDGRANRKYADTLKVMDVKNYLDYCETI